MMSTVSQALPYIRGISPYLPGKPITQLSREMGIPQEQIIKLASNENPLGMSPLARRAIEAALAGAERYPDQFELIAALAERHGVAAEQIVLGNGSNDLLDLVARAFLSAGRSSVVSEYAFAIYALVTEITGGETIVAAAKHYGHDPVTLLAAIRPDTRVLWIANPNNPTGTFLPYADVRALIERIPPHVVVVLDEAYTEYLPPAERVDSVAWVRDFPNLVVTRTFSKIYGLAGLRVGYAVAQAAVADLMNRVRQPFNVGNLGLAAALAALDDHLFLAESYTLNRQGMAQLIAGVKHLGVEHIPSHGNFITIAVPDGAAINQRLLKQGVIVRPLGGYGMPNHLRVTIGRETENQRFLASLEKALHG